MSERIEIDKELLQAIFDLAVNTMDFGSGFWDDEDVKWGRRAAEILGLDPMVGTPRSYRVRIAHTCKPVTVERWFEPFGMSEEDLRRRKAGWTLVTICDWCEQPPEHEVHQSDDPE